jgi:hypothetical protein
MTDSLLPKTLNLGNTGDLPPTQDLLISIKGRLRKLYKEGILKYHLYLDMIDIIDEDADLNDEVCTPCYKRDALR